MAENRKWTPFWNGLLDEIQTTVILNRLLMFTYVQRGMPIIYMLRYHIHIHVTVTVPTKICHKLVLVGFQLSDKFPFWTTPKTDLNTVKMWTKSVKNCDFYRVNRNTYITLLYDFELTRKTCFWGQEPVIILLSRVRELLYEPLQ